METEDFAQLVAEALETVPEVFQEALDNVDIVIEDWPSFYTLRKTHLHNKYQLLGLYQGTPLTERGQGYNLVPPDKITLYQRPIEAICETPEQVRATVRRTVLHELAHHFGISDARLDELGAY